MRHVIGLDIGGTKCAVVLARVTDHIEICDRQVITSDPRRSFEQTKNILFETVWKVLKENYLDVADISAIGVSCGGPLNSSTGTILCPPNLPGWVNIPFTAMLREEFGVPAYLQNDAKACALVEWKLGAGRGARNMLFLTMGTGMGCGIIAEGQLVCGASDMAGEVGHIRIEEDGPVGFGKAGSFEGFTSGGGIARLARAQAYRALEQGTPFRFAPTPDSIEKLDTRQLAAAAKAGDEAARGIFSFVGEKLGKGLAVLIDALNPEVIVIGSVFQRCEDLIRPAMETVLQKECLSYSLNACQIKAAQTADQIGDLASAMVAVHGAGLPLLAAEPLQTMAFLTSLIKSYPALADAEPNIREAYSLLRDSFLKGGKLLLCGNGGSAADCDHIVGELMKGFRLPRRLTPSECVNGHSGLTDEEKEYFNAHLQRALPAISLTQHTALTTAFGNDVAADLSFAQQVWGYGKPGDVLLSISTSGNSRNVVLAAKLAKEMGLRVIAFTGPAESELSRVSDVCVQVPGASTAQIQELHLPLYHALCSMLEQSFFGNGE